MKVKKLNIKSYKHLEDLNFDFIYPNGHKKAGMPLDKICLIGQSATGKTSILELIKENFSKLRTIEVINNSHFFGSSNSFNGSIEYTTSTNESLILNNNQIIINGISLSSPEGHGGGTIGKLVNESLKLAYFSSEILSKESINIFNQNPISINNNQTDDKYKEMLDVFKNKNYVFEFNQAIDDRIWYTLLKEILSYRKKFTQLASELINKGAIGNITKLNNEFNKWSEMNLNPLSLFAEKFNPILNKFNLEVDLINTEYSIPIKSKLNEEIIPISSLSTGTKSLLITMFPLFELDTKNSILLIDEPERSLFPDMQIDLISFYQNIIDPSSQLFVATHSPFIAAAFEPEERFILYFNEKGKVEIRNGESPIGDDPNDLLRNDFKINYYNEFGKKAYKEYMQLKVELAQENDFEKKKELLKKVTIVGDKYNF